MYVHAAYAESSGMTVWRSTTFSVELLASYIVDIWRQNWEN